MLVAVHYNPHLGHQRELAAAWGAGLNRHGERHELTDSPTFPADVHIVLGPHYALPYWTHHPRVVLLDRAFWDDPAYVTLGWLLPDGGRLYRADRPPDRWRAQAQTLGPLKAGTRRLLLGDYLEDRHLYARLMGEHGITGYRPHPYAPAWPECPADVRSSDLAAVLTDYDVAYGFKTTALVTAGLHGLEIVAKDPRSLAARWSREHRERWCYDLAYANWSRAEITSGAAWEYLNDATSSR